MKPEDVPAGALLLDTNVFSWLAWRRGPYVDWAALVDGHPYVLSFATVGELRSGARKAFGEARRVELERLIRQCVVVPATDQVTSQWADIHARFRGQVSENDMWTAACALTQDPVLPIATDDQDFMHLQKEFPIVVVHPDS